MRALLADDLANVFGRDFQLNYTGMLARDLRDENVFGIVHELPNNHLYEFFHSSTLRSSPRRLETSLNFVAFRSVAGCSLPGQSRQRIKVKLSK